MKMNKFNARHAPGKFIILVMSMALLLGSAWIAGCGKNEETGSTTASENPTSTTAAGSSTTSATATAATSTSPATETTPAQTTTGTTADWSLNPLTGEPLTNARAAGQRPVAIMINNIQQALPQIGISQADLIYEMQVEGGITRLMAVFADVESIPEIGSIRSARHDYIDLCGGLDAILVHVGASNLAFAQFSKQKTNHIDLMFNSAAYWRDQEWLKNRGTEHSVKSTGGRLLAAIAKNKFRTEIRTGQKPAFSFRAAGDFAAAAGQAASEITVPYSSYDIATFKYDASTRLYSKGQFNKPHLDLATGEPLKFTNVLLLVTKVTICDNKGHKDALLVKGKGYYLAGGKWQVINWQKGETADSFVFTGDDGKELLVNTGKSYVGIVSDKQKITFKP